MQIEFLFHKLFLKAIISQSMNLPSETIRVLYTVATAVSYGDDRFVRADWLNQVTLETTEVFYDSRQLLGFGSVFSLCFLLNLANTYCTFHFLQFQDDILLLMCSYFYEEERKAKKMPITRVLIFVLRYAK